MRKSNLLKAISLALIVFMLNGCANTSIMSKEKALDILEVNALGGIATEGNFSKLELKIDKDSIKSEKMVYKVKKPDLDIKKIKEKAKNLSINGDVTETNEMIRIRSEEADFIVDKKTGSERYFTKQMRGEIQDKPIKKFLTDEEYVKIAQKFLNDNELSRKDMIYKGINKNYTIGTIDNKGNETKEIVKIEVMFKHSDIDGIQYTGIGPKISVWFGDNGQIIGYGSIWRELEELQVYPLVTLDEAIDKVKKGLAPVNIEESNAEGTVEQVEIVLWSDPDGYEQKFVIPHYILKGKTKTGKDFTAITRAVSDNYIKENDPYLNNSPSEK